MPIPLPKKTLMNEDRYGPKTRKVWRRNVDEEMVRLTTCLKQFPLIAFDTEYPGVIYQTFIDSSDDERYIAMKANVESTKLIQCGFTLFNANGEIGGTWEINFSNFGDPSDTRNEISIEFLRKHGLDLNKIRNEGIDMFRYEFFPKLLYVFHCQKNVEFITFQGAYDFAYFLCILNNGKLPETRGEFASQVVNVFGNVYDLKVMAGFCEGISEHIGLSKLANLLKISRVGRAHHAGSDSLMTALVFIRLKQVYEDSKFAKGMLYGIGKRNRVTPSPVHHVPLMFEQNQVSYPSSFHNGYVPNYDHAPIIIWDHSGVPWVFYDKGMYVDHQFNHIHSNTCPYQTPYAADYFGPIPNY